MGMSAQGKQQQGQVFYDADTNQYYTQSSQRQSNPLLMMLGQNNRNAKRNYITNFNQESVTAKPVPQHNYIDIAALFPELYQGAQGMQGDSQASAGLLGTQGAAQSASSGAGRFM
jgi:hypothetical protein